MLATSRLAEKGELNPALPLQLCTGAEDRGWCWDKSVRCGRTTLEAHSKARSNQERSSDRKPDDSVRARFDHTALEAISGTCL